MDECGEVAEEGRKSPMFQEKHADGEVDNGP